MTMAHLPVALITGGAGAIGLATARRFARAGWLPVLLDRDGGRLERCKAALDDEFDMQAGTIALELTAPDSPRAAMEQVDAAYGRLDCLVNNAGLSRGHRLGEVTLADWDAVLAINLTVPMLLCQESLRFWRRQRAGSIVNIASRVWVSGSGPAYTASKAGVVGLTRSLAVQLGPLGVTANAVAPSYIDTAFNAPRDDAQRAERELQHLRLGVLARLCTPEDVAGAVCFLASPDARFITAEVLHVAGGAQLAGRPPSGA